MASAKKQSKARKPAVEAPVDPWAEAVAHLRAVDEKWAGLIDRVGPCRLDRRDDRFGTLVRAIIGQQISSKAASSIDKKLRDLGGDPHRPEPLIERGLGALRSAGLSGQKAQYILNLSEAVRSGRLPLEEFDAMEDDAITATLTSVKGIGPWTAEMFLIFSLNRPDVLSTGDLGIRMGLKSHHGLDDVPTPKLCRELTEPLRPYRSVAMWYLWEVLDNPPKT